MSRQSFGGGFSLWCGGSKVLAWLVGINLAAGTLFCILALCQQLFGLDVSPFLALFALPADFGLFLHLPWTLVTYMVTHFSLLHLLFNTLWLVWFGRMLLDVSPQKSLLWLYIGGGVAGGLFYLGAAAATHLTQGVLTGASAAVMSLMTATALAMPNRVVRLFLFGNVKLKWIALFTILFTLLVGRGNIPTQCAHAGGILFGVFWHYCGGRLLTMFRPRPKQVKRKSKEVAEVLKDRSGYSRRQSQRHDRSDAPTARKADDGERLDQLLDKIRVSGYASLSQKEKQELNAISERIDSDR